MGEKQKTEKRERGAKVGENNGQATHGARKHAWRTQAAWANTSYCVSCENSVLIYVILNVFFIFFVSKLVF